MALDDIMAQALEITRAQAGVRSMSAAEAAAYAAEVARGIKAAMDGPSIESKLDEPQMPAIDPKASIKETTITCLECGKTFKTLTIRHLRLHGLDAKSYCEKWGFKKGTKLACKGLVRMRRKKMNEMKLWERRFGPSEEK